MKFICKFPKLKNSRMSFNPYSTNESISPKNQIFLLK